MCGHYELFFPLLPLPFFIWMLICSISSSPSTLQYRGLVTLVTKKTLRGWKMYARGSLASYFGENIPPLNQICFSSPQQFKFIVKSVFFKLYFLPIAIVLRILKKLLYSSHQEDLMLSLIVPKSAHFRISCFSVPHSSFYWSKRSHQCLQEVTEEENFKMLRDNSINIIILQHNP